MTSDMQSTYSVDTDDLWSIFCPQKGTLIMRQTMYDLAIPIVFLKAYKDTSVEYKEKWCD